MKSFPSFSFALTAAAMTALAAPVALASPPPALLQRVAQANPPAEAAHPPTGTDTGPSRNAARSRMRECGHQWSSMKKSGAAAGMTWKDFSQGCLAKP